MSRPTRRRFLSGAATAAVLTAAPFVRTAHAAGRLSIGLWDHWVPGANNVMTALVNEWAGRNSVDVQIDYITSQGNKNLLTIGAELQARAGHDVLTFPAYSVPEYADRLDPVDDIMDSLTRENGPAHDACHYLGKVQGRWVAVPATAGSQIKAVCSRVDLMKQYAGIDFPSMYPLGAPPKADKWTLATFIKAAELCHKAGYSFGIGLGTTTDSVDAASAIFQAFGAMLVDARGTITVRSDPVRQAMEYFRRLVPFLPPDATSWDDASNNKWLVAGRGALILNPPSAWAVAKRDAPDVASNCWTHGLPTGPAGRFAPYLPYFWGIWSFARNKSAAKSLIAHLSQAGSTTKIVAASGGYDIPPFQRLTTVLPFSEAGAPSGTLYHYPNPHLHQKLFISGAPAPPKIGSRIFAQAILTKMIVRHAQGEALERTLAWAESEIEILLRT